MNDNRPSAEYPATLEEFRSALGARNPFLVNRVDRPYDKRLVDVDSIHAAAFQRLLDLGEQARVENRGIGAVVWGEAGVGKSHLLARLARLARPAVYVYLHNLQASPERLPRTVLRSVLNVLAHGQAPTFCHSELFGLVNTVLRNRGMYRGSWTAIETVYRALVDRLAEEDPTRGVLFDRTVYHVLYRFYEASHSVQNGTLDEQASLAVRWLSGEALEPAEGVLLALPTERRPSDLVALGDNQQVKQVLVALTQLARAAGRLFLLCFDQVDNLDEAQVKALTRFLHDLLDSAGNLLIVTTGVRQTLLSYLQRGVITETSWDRVGQVEISLGRLRVEQGRELLRGRLESFLGPFHNVADVSRKRAEDPLFPLGGSWYARRVESLPDFRPRDLIGWASERWTQLQEGLTGSSPREWLERWPEEAKPPPPLPPPPVDEKILIDQLLEAKIAEKREQLRRESSLLPAGEDHLLGVLDSLLHQCLVPEKKYWLDSCRRHPLPKHGQRHPYDLTLEQHVPPDGRPLRLGVRVLVTSHGNSVAASLKWLLDDPSPPQRILLVTDARQGLPFGREGRRRLEQLQQRDKPRFQYLALPFDEYATLEALDVLVRMARGGEVEIDLAGQRRSVTEAEAIASHHRRDRYLACPLLRDLLGGLRATRPGAVGAPPQAVAPAMLNERQAREFLMAQLALADSLTLEELARRYAAQLKMEGQIPSVAARLREIALRLATDGLLQANSGTEGLALRRKSVLAR